MEFQPISPISPLSYAYINLRLAKKKNREPRNKGKKLDEKHNCFAITLRDITQTRGRFSLYRQAVPMDSQP